jgi:glutamate-5-semialdehyde dehydrogenase
MSHKDYLTPLCQKARGASRKLAKLDTTTKNNILLTVAEALGKQEREILQENLKDLELAREKKLETAKIERLTLTRNRIEEMVAGLKEIAALPDPVGEILQTQRRPNGMMVGQMTVPIGVIAIIYESRPNVTVDSASLCLKSGNVVILKGGSEAIHSNRKLAAIFSETLRLFNAPEAAVSFIDQTDREVTNELLKLDEWIDLVIPRGGEGLIRAVTESSRIPVIKHDKGLCHIYVDESAGIEMALKLALNAKVQRPGTCNAMETLLVHEKVAPGFLPDLLDKLNQRGVEIRGCPETQKYAEYVKPASDLDYQTEFLDLILAVKVVSSLDDAMNHIEKYGSRHTESIITENYRRGMRFLNEVDASAVMINASTRLNDGYQFGLGAEIGISTSRIHARGPMGLKELTSKKFVVFGSGQIRE